VPNLDRSIWVDARQLIATHGKKAALEAMRRADAMASAKDDAEVRRMLQVLRAIAWLQDTSDSDDAGPEH
jgi:hypothetical protein